MKIQYLAVIFIIIMMPLIIVFSEYMNTQMTIVRTEQVYDERLLGSTYDTIKAFQLNTINTTFYTPENRVKNIESVVNTFYHSLITSFQLEGNNAEILKEYVPAIVFTMYDGYYIYSPYTNKIDHAASNSGAIDTKYNDGNTLSGVKPFVPYSCKYEKDNNKEYIITYSMDNYVCVDIFDMDKKIHERRDGYLLSGIVKDGDDFKYDGITFTKTDKEVLKENIDGTMYEYVLYNGSKFYKDKDKELFFYIDENGERISQAYEKGKENFKILELKLQAGNYAYNYYKDAYEFTNWIKENLGENFGTQNIKESVNYDGYKFSNVGNIFEGNIQDSDSNFNRHRADVIRAIITTNLSKAISGFSLYSKASNVEFLMPKISETDWELLENNICVATFLQGMKIGDNTYNNYSVVANKLTKEYVDENDIYMLKNDTTYVRANDATLNNNTIETKDENITTFYPGILKINFELRQSTDGNKRYNPIINGEKEPYLQSYTSMAGSFNENNINNSDMYRYMRSRNETEFSEVKKAYYMALAREKNGSFKYSRANN